MHLPIIFPLRKGEGLVPRPWERERVAAGRVRVQGKKLTPVAEGERVERLGKPGSRRSKAGEPENPVSEKRDLPRPENFQPKSISHSYQMSCI
jgi:hypothetical protein